VTGIGDGAQLAADFSGVIGATKRGGNVPVELAATRNEGWTRKVFAFSAGDGITDGEDGGANWQLLACPDGVAVGFVEKAHSFHEEAGGAARGSGGGGSVGRVEIDFEFAFGPKDDFQDSVVASEIVDFSIAALAGGKVKLGAITSLPDNKAARLLSHFEGLQKIDHAHLFEAALDDAGARGLLLQLFEEKSIDNFLGGPDEIFNEEGFGDEVLGTVHERAKAFFNVTAAGHEKKWNVAGGFAGTKLFKELAAIEAGHFVVAKYDVGRLVDNFEESIGAILSHHDFAKGFEALGHEIAHHGIVLSDKELDAFGSGRAHRLALRPDLVEARR
jgi:hypothetical protein